MPHSEPPVSKDCEAPSVWTLCDLCKAYHLIAVRVHACEEQICLLTWLTFGRRFDWWLTFVWTITSTTLNCGTACYSSFLPLEWLGLLCRLESLRCFRQSLNLRCILFSLVFQVKFLRRVLVSLAGVSALWQVCVLRFFRNKIAVIIVGNAWV